MPKVSVWSGGRWLIYIVRINVDQKRTLVLARGVFNFVIAKDTVSTIDVSTLYPTKKIQTCCVAAVRVARDNSRWNFKSWYNQTADDWATDVMPAASPPSCSAFVLLGKLVRPTLAPSPVLSPHTYINHASRNFKCHFSLEPSSEQFIDNPSPRWKTTSSPASLSQTPSPSSLAPTTASPSWQTVFYDMNGLRMARLRIEPLHLPSTGIYRFQNSAPSTARTRLRLSRTTSI